MFCLPIQPRHVPCYQCLLRIAATSSGALTDKRSRDARQILSLMGIKYLYSLNVFLYSMFAFVALALAWLLVAPAATWKQLTKDERLEAAYAT